MRKKWNKLVYIDLYAGSGLSKNRETNQIVKSSPLIALSIPVKFDKYIFCEEKNELYDALNMRLQSYYNRLNIKTFNSDCTLIINDIIKEIPAYSNNNKVLTFCFIDPYDLNLNFDIISRLTGNIVDFLVLQALHMDANRNYRNYINENNEKIAKYLGNPHWRERWQELKLLPKDFVKFLADEYDLRMKSLGYLPAERHSIKLPDKNVPLYYLTFYSKHERGAQFFKEVNKYSTDQLSFNI